jgi:hypothetical protein
MDITAAIQLGMMPRAISEDFPLLLFLSPEGHVIKAWCGGAGAANLGIAARQKLRTPAYSQIGATK